jgi:hypothetical protein
VSHAPGDLLGKDPAPPTEIDIAMLTGILLAIVAVGEAISA